MISAHLGDRGGATNSVTFYNDTKELVRESAGRLCPASSQRNHPILPHGSPEAPLFERLILIATEISDLGMSGSIRTTPSRTGKINGFSFADF
jgi:hypothetical protein